MLRQEKETKQKPQKAYQPQPLATLKKIAKKLATHYEGNDNPLDRSLAFLTHELVTYLNDHKHKLANLKVTDENQAAFHKFKKRFLHNQKKTLKGLFVFSLESAAHNHGYFYKDPYYQMLKAELNITSKDAIDPIDKFIWLSQYRKVVEGMSDKGFPGTEVFYWKTKAGLLEAIDDTLKQLLTKIDPDIRHLSEDYPSDEALRKSCKMFSQLYVKKKEEYVRKSKNPLANVPTLGKNPDGSSKKPGQGLWSMFSCVTTYLGATDPKRKKQCDFVEFIDQKCDEFSQSGLVELPKEGLPDHCSEAYMIRMAMFIYIAMDINRKQVYADLHSANGQSAMYDLCIEIMHVMHLRRMNPGYKILCLQTLKNFFEEKLLPNAETETQKHQIQLFTKRIGEHVATLATQQVHYDPTSKAWLERYVKDRSYTLIIHEGAQNIGIPAVSNAIAGTLGAALGFVTFGPAGSVIGVNFGLVAGKYTLQPLLIQILDRIINTTTQCAKDMYRQIVFDTSKAGIEALLEIHAKFVPAYKEERKLVKALLSLPDHVFPQENKQKIKETENFKYYSPENLVPPKYRGP